MTQGGTMVSKIFVNLPVKDLDRSIDFFKAIGFSFNPQFTDKTAACMVMSDDIYAMLLTHDKVKEFTKKSIADAHKTTELLTALSVESKTKVNELADKALKAGAQEAYTPKDYGFMFTRSFEDPDGHIWEVFWMDEAHVQTG
jgi:predicted lactoylglutathione lyase